MRTSGEELHQLLQAADKHAVDEGSMPRGQTPVGTAFSNRRPRAAERSSLAVGTLTILLARIRMISNTDQTIRRRWSGEAFRDVLRHARGLEDRLLLRLALNDGELRVDRRAAALRSYAMNR